ncbi:serine/threonine-protein kinase [Microbacterium sp.]|uniref:serine/threonine-protein kinase n=1 Tax=Microbacterium sp. TaxID=51671 RepID=UPI003A919B7F
MSPRRTPAAPPELPGFTYVDLLGSGGFADVYLYEQQLPRRRVAVKVLLTDRMSSGSVREFTDEANVMAMLSTHPAIVTIYQAGLAGDGRPYLVMEYCPKPNLQVRYRREPFSVAESLRVGVQVAAAVETAHRAGVLHRDIKPANILVTEYNRPALTDFGIASSTAAAAESAGLSIPWSPPESFADAPHSDVRSDVYALGATIYTLLAGRSPFELKGQRNTAADLIGRIESAQLPPLGRADAPLSLQHALERAMSKNPADRHQRAVDFARALQKVQIELSLAVTPIDILDDGLPDDIEDDEDDGLTRVRGVVSIDPQTAPAAGLTRPSDVTRPAPTTGPTAPAPTLPQAGPPSFPDLDATVLRPGSAGAAASGIAPTGGAPGAPAATGAPGAPAVTGATDASTLAHIRDVPVDPVEGLTETRPHARVGMWAAIGGGVVAVALIAIALVALPALLGGDAPGPKPTAAPPTSKPHDALPTTVAPPSDLKGVIKGENVVWTWTNTDTAEGDFFVWQDASRPDREGKLNKADRPTVTQPADSSGRTCISVQTLRTDGGSSDAVTECVP